MYLLKEEIIIDDDEMEYCFLDRKLGKDVIDELKMSENYNLFHDVLIINSSHSIFLFIKKDIHFVFYEKINCEKFFNHNVSPAWKNETGYFFLYETKFYENNRIFTDQIDVSKRITDRVTFHHRKFHNGKKYIQTDLIYAYRRTNNILYYLLSVSQFRAIKAPSMNINNHELVYFTTSECYDSEITGYFNVPNEVTNMTKFINIPRDISYFNYFIYSSDDGYLVRVYDNDMLLIEETVIDKYYSCKGYFNMSMLLVEKNDELFLLPKKYSGGFSMTKASKKYRYIFSICMDELKMINISDMQIKKYINIPLLAYIDKHTFFLLNDENDFYFFDCSEKSDCHKEIDKCIVIGIDEDASLSYINTHFSKNACYIFSLDVVNIYHFNKSPYVIYLVTKQKEIYYFSMVDHETKLIKDRRLITKNDITCYNDKLTYDSCNYVKIEKSLDIKSKIIIIGSSIIDKGHIASIKNFDLFTLVSYGRGPATELAHEILNYYQTTFLDQTGKYPLFKENISVDKSFLFYMGYALLWCLYHVKKFPFLQPLQFYIGVTITEWKRYIGQYFSQYEKIIHWKNQDSISFETYLSDPENYFEGKNFDEIFDEMFKLKNNQTLDIMFTPLSELFNIFSVTQFGMLSSENPVTRLKNDHFYLKNINNTKLVKLLIKQILTLTSDETSILLKNWTGYPYVIDQYKLIISETESKTMFSTCSKTLYLTDNFLKDESGWPILWIKDNTMHD